jgi:hypothetical protein
MIVLLPLISGALAQDTCNDPMAGTAHETISGKVIYGALDPTPLNPRSGDETVGICGLSGGVYELREVTECTPSDAASTPLGISDNGPAADSTVGPVVNPAGKFCRDTRLGGGSTTAVKLYPFDDYFQFGLWYTGYCGRDKVYGTDGPDYLYSHYDATTPPPEATDGGVSCPAMTGPEVMCGYGGDDFFVTQNASPTVIYGVCLDGGGGTDECIVSSTNAIDSMLNCEWSANLPGFDTCNCGCGVAPSDSFFPNYVP